jgi:hypothetical protein
MNLIHAPIGSAPEKQPLDSNALSTAPAYLSVRNSHALFFQKFSAFLLRFSNHAHCLRLIFCKTGDSLSRIKLQTLVADATAFDPLLSLKHKDPCGSRSPLLWMIKALERSSGTVQFIR